MKRAVFLVALLAGCTGHYTVKIDGDVQGTDRETPRAVRATVLEGSEAISARQAGLGHLKPLLDAEVTISLKMKGDDLARHADTYKVDSRSAEFHMKKEGEGKLGSVVIRVVAQGRKPIETTFPCPPDVPFEATVMAVLDEAIPENSPTVGNPPGSSGK